MCRRRGGRAAAQSYQRLEFLGDRVLGLVVSEMLYEAFPEASEGELSVRLARLVRRETCAEVARGLGRRPACRAGRGRGARRRAQEGGDPRRRLRGADRRGVPRRRLRRGARRWCAAPGTRACAPTPTPDPGRQDRRAGMGAGARPRRRRATREVERSGPAHLPRFVMQVEARRLRARARRGDLQARRRTGGGARLSRPMGTTMTALRLRRPDRRPQRGQVDAASTRWSARRSRSSRARRRRRAGRCAASSSRARRRSCSSTRRACSRRSAGSTGRCRTPPGARRPTPTRWRCSSTPAPRSTHGEIDRGRAAHPRGADASARSRSALILNKIDLVEPPKLLALADAAQRGAAVRRDFHDLRRDRQRPRPAEARPRAG